MSPFKSPQQEAYFWAKMPEKAKEWVEKYGHAPGYKEYLKKRNKKKKRSTKKSMIEDILFLTAQECEEEGLFQLADRLDTLAFKVRTAKKLTYKEKQAAPCVFPKSHPKVKDNKDHYPIPDLSHGSNALSRSHQDVGDWFAGTKEELINTVRRAVYKKFPGLKERKEERE